MMKSDFRDTSLDAYLKVQPQLGEKQKRIYALFREYGNCTNLELSTKSGIPINQVTGRTRELYTKGYLVQAGKRACNISGMTVCSWSVKLK